MEKKNNKKIILTKDQVQIAIGKRKNCILEPEYPCTLCGACLYCDLDENKLCNNCGKCLDSYNTDDKGFVKIKVDKIIKQEPTLEDFYKQLGLEGDEE